MKVIIGTESKTIPVYLRQGTVYIPIKDFAQLLSAPVRYDERTESILIENAGNSLQFTSRNPFVVLTSKESKKKIYQLPTSTYFINGGIYIPLAYSFSYLNSFFGSKLTLKDNIITVKVEKIKNSNLFPLSGLSLDKKANGTLIRIFSNKKVQSYNSSYNKGLLTITLNGVTADISKIKIVKGDGVVKQLAAKNVDNNTQIKIAVSSEYTASEVLNDEKSNDILITVHNKVFSKNESRNKEKWNFDVVVLDAGHGGKDAGAIGVNGVKEKDVNLAVTLKLGKLIEKYLPGVKVVYTRSDDRFIELYKRGKIANEKEGKLFISIHCNSTAARPTTANGFEVYLLRPGRTKEAIHIAERENSVIQYEDNPARYQKLTDENFILVSMAHSAYMKYSEKFSDLLNKHMSDGLNMNSRGVKQAGFFVLVGASMPSVLIETGFLTNTKDANFLKGDKGQQQMAQSIFNAIKNYREYYEAFIENE